MGTASLKDRCIYNENSSSSTVLHRFGSICFLAIIIVPAWINVAFAALSVSVDDNLIVGVNATFSCNPEGTLTQLTWSKTVSEGMAPNPEHILRYLVGLSASYGSDVDSTHYEFDEASNEIKVLGVTLNDEGRYWCEARVLEYPDAFNSTLASIIVPTAADTSSITYKGETYMEDGGIIEVDAGEQTFTCITTGIKPAATFAWTPSTSSEKTMSVANGMDSRLFDSSSIVTIEIVSPTTLKCKASNTVDESLDVEITVNLSLKGQTETGPSSSAERISFRIMIFIQCLAWMAFKLMYI